MAVPFWDEFEEGYEGPLYATEPWDLLVLNGIKVPGISTVKCTPRMKIEIPKETGRDGGPAIERGHDPARVDIAVKIWTPRQWEAMQAVLLAVWRRPGQEVRYAARDGKLVETTRKAVTIAHPACALYNVSSILIESPDSPEPGPEIGVRVLKMKAVQYIPPSSKPATKKTTGAGPALAVELQGKRNSIPPPPSTQVVARAAATPLRGVATP